MIFFADDSSLFSVVNDPKTSAQELNHDLTLISNWAFQWKMCFNPDPSKQAVQQVFSRKRKKIDHPILYFNNLEAKSVNEHKHLGLIMDTKLTFASHINDKLSKARKGIGILKSLNQYLPTKILDQIYKMYIRPHLDFCDIIYHEPNTLNSFDSSINLRYLMNTVERIQYHAALSITGAWQGTNLDKIYEELGWESLTNRRHYRRLIQFYKIQNNLVPSYLKEPIPVAREFMRTLRTQFILSEIKFNTDSYRDSFYPDSIRSWNRLGNEFRNSPTLKSFKSKMIALYRPPIRSIFDIHDTEGVKWLYQLRVGLSPLNYHKHSHNFLDTPSNKCIVCNTIENTQHFMLSCSIYNDARIVLFRSLNTLLPNFYDLSDTNKTNVLLYGDKCQTYEVNKQILLKTITFLKETKRLSS